MNVYEMEGFLRGKCLPGDIRVNESNAEYLVRKLSEVSELQGEVTALVATLEKSREVSGCPEGIDLQDWVKKLASESVALKQFPEQIVKFMGSLGTSEIGSDTKEKIELAASRIKTSATDRIYAEAEARGVEKFAKKLESRGRHQDYVEIANAFAKQLREGDK
ncbi:TPA: hypothetical protein N3282_001444 [Klebsiella aerogenes]|nr:hypothetical protein [Klebsiella aerogenes]